MERKTTRSKHSTQSWVKWVNLTDNAAESTNSTFTEKSRGLKSFFGTILTQNLRTGKANQLTSNRVKLGKDKSKLSTSNYKPCRITKVWNVVKRKQCEQVENSLVTTSVKELRWLIKINRQPNWITSKIWFASWINVENAFSKTVDHESELSQNSFINLRVVNNNLTNVLR